MNCFVLSSGAGRFGATFGAMSAAVRGRACVIACLVAMTAGPASAAQVTWLGDTSGDMTLGANWVGGVAPVTNTDGIVLGPAGLAGTSLTLDVGTQYATVGGAITYPANAAAYTISGSGKITLGTGSIVSNSPLPQVINNPLRRNTSNSIAVNANAGTLVFTNTYDISGGNLSTVALGPTIGSAVVFGGDVINSSTTSGTFGFTVTSSGTGYGTVTLGGSSALTGPIAVGSNVTLKLAHPLAYAGGTIQPGVATATNVGLWVAADSAVPAFTLASGSLGNAASSQFVVLGSGTSGVAVTNQTISSISMGAQQAFQFSKAGNVTSGVPAATVTGTTAIGVQTAGRSNGIVADGVRLSLGAVTTTGTGTSSQVLVLGGNTPGSRVTGTISNGVATSLSVTKAGSGTWALGAANTYTGATVVNAGVLTLDFSAAGAPASNILYNGVTTGTTTVAGGALAVVGKDGASSTQALGQFNALGNLASRLTLRSGSGGTTAVTVTGVTLNTGAVLDFDLGPGTTFTNSGASGTAGFVGAGATYGGTEFARYDASKNVVGATSTDYGTLTGTSAGSTSGYYKIDGGYVRDPGLDLAFKGIRLTGTGAGDVMDLAGGSLTFSNSGILYRGGGDGRYTITGGTMQTFAGSNTGVIFNVAADATLRVEAAVANNAASLTQVNKAGAGTLVVPGAKTYTGNTYLDGGVTSIDTLTDGGVAFLISGTASGGQNTITVTSTAGLTVGQNLAGTGIAAGTTIASIAGTTVTLSSTLTANASGNAAVTAFTAANYSGIGASSAANTSLRFDGGTLRYTGGAASTNRSFQIYGNGATIEASGSGALVWAPSAALSLVNNNNNNVGPGTTNAAQNAVLTLGGTSTADNTFSTASAPLANAAGNALLSVVKAGSGRWILSGSNSYSGGTRLAAGTLAVSGSSALGAYGAVTFTGGTLQYLPGTTTDYSYRVHNSTAPIAIDTNGGAVTYASTIDESNIGGLVKSGAGVLTLNGRNTYTGSTVVTAGTLSLGTGGSFAASATVSVGSGAVIDASGVSGGLSVASGQSLTGQGTVVGGVQIPSGATLAPGATVGTLPVTGNLTWGLGGNYNWQMLSATGTAGAANAWDLVTATGTLAIAATTDNPFRINLWSLASASPLVSGSAANFNSSQNGTWKIASATGGISGFSADKFAITTSAANGTGGFANALAGGSFSVAQNGNEIDLVFTVAPPAAITINVASGTQTQSQAGYPLLSGSIPVVKAGAGTLVVDQANTLTGSTSVQAGRLQLANGAALGTSKLVPLAGGTVTLTPALQTTVGGLAPNAGGLVDVGNGMVTVAAGLSAADMVTAIVTGLGDGTWNGTSGITSSVAAASGGDRTVGWLDNGDGTVTFAFAAAGDTNLDWQVDIIDAANFLAGGKFDSGSPATWNEGDFTYDGVVDILDAASFLSNGLFDAGPYNSAGQAGAIAAVPEPSVWALLAAASAVATVGRMRRRR